MNDLIFYGLSALALIIMLKFIGIDLSIFDDPDDKEILHYKRHRKRSRSRWGRGADGGISEYFGGCFGGDGGGGGGD